MTITYVDYGDIWVCTDCYFAHHYGATEVDGQWFVGESDTPSDREPLGEIPDDLEVADNTCSNHRYQQDDAFDHANGIYLEPCAYCGSFDDEDGLQEFSWSRCQGCGSHLGGSRSRLHLSKRETT